MAMSITAFHVDLPTLKVFDLQAQENDATHRVDGLTFTGAGGRVMSGPATTVFMQEITNGVVATLPVVLSICKITALGFSAHRVSVGGGGSVVQHLFRVYMYIKKGSEF